MPEETPSETARREADEAQKAHDAEDARLKAERAAETGAQQAELAAQTELDSARKANKDVTDAETKLFIAKQNVANAEQQVRTLEAHVATLAQALNVAQARSRKVADALDPTRGLTYTDNAVRLAAEAIRTPDLDRAKPSDAVTMVEIVCKLADDLPGMWSAETTAAANAVEKVDPRWSSPLRDMVGTHVSNELKNWSAARATGDLDKLATATSALTREIGDAKTIMLKTGGVTTTAELPDIAQRVAAMLDAVALYAKKQLRFAGGAPSRALMAEHVEQLPALYETTDATASTARHAADLQEFWMAQSKAIVAGLEPGAARELKDSGLRDALRTLREQLKLGTGAKPNDLNRAVIDFYDAIVASTAVANGLSDQATAARLRDLLGGIVHAVDCELQFAAINQSATLAAA